MVPIESLSIRVLMGYLPDVSEKDAKAYALGIAEKHNESSQISFYGVFPYERGFVYEVQEGGVGKSYAPSILKYFEDNAELHTSDTPLFAVVPSSIRKLYVEKSERGVNCLLLPEGDLRTPSEWLVPGVLLKAAVPSRKGVLFTGIGVFVAGTVAFLGAMATQYQPYLPPPKAPVEKVVFDNFPMAQWNSLTEAQASGYVSALKYSKGKWEIKTKIPDALPPPIPEGGPR